MSAARWFFFVTSGLRRIRSTTGSKNANVLPDPVTASTTTSLLARKSGMVDDWTGVGRSKFMLSSASRIHGESAGVMAPHDRSGCAGAAASTALAFLFRLLAETIAMVGGVGAVMLKNLRCGLVRCRRANHASL